jgi:hypothetical protein
MLHWHYVGHFDPRDPVNTSAVIYKPKVVRPISEAVVEGLLSSFGQDIAEFVSRYPEGYVVCNWSVAPYRLWDPVHQFADRLAEVEGAVIMNEQFLVEHPPEARRAQQAAHGEAGLSRFESGGSGKLPPPASGIDPVTGPS